ncbi:MAG TPA: tail fiber domain-containing protein [Candidatus Baltobacteraceae bacterium]|nr:tail fiber domain-containing protein [Candidatus Baltobacteraceae bacterium]
MLAGSYSYVCDQNSAIAAGQQNIISSASDSAYYSFIGGGFENTITGLASGAAIAAGLGNAISTSNTSGYAFIGAGTNNEITDASGFVGAGGTNTVSALNGAVVAGENNSVTVQDGVVGGGSSNAISGEYGFIGAGSTNTLSGEYGVLAGGLNNTVSGEGAYIAAGGYNTASGEGAVVDGGFNSSASGTFATVPGGYVNSAAGTYSLAAGARASAAQTGTFVWSDGSDGDTILTSSRAYQFLARASGGFTLYTNAASTVGAQLAAGSGTWASLSDRNAKTNIVPLDDETVLAKLDALPISRWSYKTEHGVRHVGPMAQDFYAAFNVGEDDRHITSIDEDGIALAAIKALHSRVASLDAENARIRAKDAAQIGQLRRRLAADEAHERRLDAEVASLVARSLR